MVQDENAIILFRFGEQRWIDKFIEGDMSFSCSGAFIHQAIKTGNDVQGDPLEAVFARCKKDDALIEQMKSKLGNDLEIIPDGDHVFLRRESAKKRPIFCFYGYKAGDALHEREITKLGVNKIRHDFDTRMYEGFADNLKVCNVISESHRFTQLTLMPDPFVKRVKIAMAIKGYGYTMKPINYTEFSKDTFFIEPTRHYDELFYKFPKYSYQYEARICLKDMSLPSIFDRFSVDIGHLTENEFKKTYTPMYMVFDAVIAKRK